MVTSTAVCLDSLRCQIERSENVVQLWPKKSSKMFHLIYQTRETVFHQTPRREQKIARSGLFLTKFEVFQKPMKRCLECLIYLFSLIIHQVRTKEITTVKEVRILLPDLK